MESFFGMVFFNVQVILTMLGSAFLALGSSVPPPVSLHDSKHVSCNTAELPAVKPDASHEVANKSAVPVPAAP